MLTMSTTKASLSSKRLFLAIEIPSPVRQYCCETITQKLLPLDNDPPSVNWVLDESMYHCTLQFLGSVNESMIPDLVQNIQAQCQSIYPITLEITGRLGCFPHIDSTNNARVIWLGLQEEAEELTQLSGLIMDATEPLGFQREKRPFRAHVTLGRVRSSSSTSGGRKRGRNPPISLPPALQDVLEQAMKTGKNTNSGEASSFQVKHVALIDSILSKQGATYQTLARFDLLGS